MFYVYCKHIKTGKEEFVNCYQTAQEAIEKIASNYNIDKRTCQIAHQPHGHRHPEQHEQGRHVYDSMIRPERKETI